MVLIKPNNKTPFPKVGLIFISIFFILIYNIIIFNPRATTIFPFLYTVSTERENITQANGTRFNDQLLNISRHEVFPTSSEYEQLPIQWNNHPRGVIVTLIRSNNKSLDLAINMIHSVVLLHSTKDKFQYPFLIFHDQSFTLSMRERILSCVRNNNRVLHISFIRLNFLTNVHLPDKFIRRKDIGYHQMCRFWSYDVFYHPAVVKMNYDYLMRMDGDSYFLDKTRIDLFQYMDRFKMDYIYRAWYSEDNLALFQIEKLFINITKPRTNCIYNNFFIIRLQWFYRSERVQSFLQELVRDDLFLREYISDGCVHTAMLDIDRKVRTKELKQIQYGHNLHMMITNSKGPFYNNLEDFYKDVANSCDHLLTINTKRTGIKQIKI